MDWLNFGLCLIMWSEVNFLFWAERNRGTAWACLLAMP